MKMMIAFRWIRTPITPMMKSAAVRASDSASTGGPPPSEYDRARYGYEEKDARQLERQQVVSEEWLRDHAHGVQLPKLLLVEVARHEELLWKPGPDDHHDLAEESEPDESGRELPPGAARIRKLRWMSEIEEHDHEQEHDHDRAGVDQDLHDADKLRVEHHIKRGETEHRVHEPERRRHRAFSGHKRQRGCERDDSEQIEVENVEERVVRVHYSPFGSSGSHISHTGCV